MFVVSRSLANFLFANSCKSYDKLFSVLDDLPVDSSERTWFQNIYQLPEDLESWISQRYFKYTFQ